MPLVDMAGQLLLEPTDLPRLLRRRRRRPTTDRQQELPDLLHERPVGTRAGIDEVTIDRVATRRTSNRRPARALRLAEPR
jgi:hypothetical protein